MTGSFQPKLLYASIIMNPNLKMANTAITADDTDGLQHEKSSLQHLISLQYTFVRIDINIDSNY